jgi:basic amino acid/polyamine antiporter, APA family
VIPAKISQVNRRGGPMYATALVTVVALIFVVVTLFTSFETLLLYESSLIWLELAVAGIAAAVLPFHRKEWFERAPAAMRRKIGSLPLITILGVFTLVGGLSLTYASISPATSLIPLNPPLLLVPVIVIVIGIVVYYISAAYHKSRGINLSLGFAEIPPE